MTKSKSLMVTRNALCLAIKIIPAEVIKLKCLLLHVGSYLFRMVRGSNENEFSIKAHLHEDINDCDNIFDSLHSNHYGNRVFPN